MLTRLGKIVVCFTLLTGGCTACALHAKRAQAERAEIIGDATSCEEREEGLNRQVAELGEELGQRVRVYVADPSDASADALLCLRQGRELMCGSVERLERERAQKGEKKL